MPDTPSAELIFVRGAIASLPKEAQVQIEETAAKIRTIIQESGDWGPVALALCGAEFTPFAE
jgi:hypothetical protein